MEVTLEEAYAEACRTIGEQIVTQRLLSRAPSPAPQESAADEPPDLTANEMPG